MHEGKRLHEARLRGKGGTSGKQQTLTFQLVTDVGVAAGKEQACYTHTCTHTKQNMFCIAKQQTGIGQ